MNTEAKKTRLLKFANELKQNGFKVYTPVNTTTLSAYCHFVKNDKIGYMDCGDYGFNFTTTHKPCKECGTGFSIEHDCIQSIKLANDCLVLAPGWALNSDIKAVKKYKNWIEYEQINNWQKWIEI
jgi:hypothetical protein